MASPSVANATTLTFASSGDEQHVSSDYWFSNVVIDNESGEAIYVATDGGTATVGGAYCLSVPNGAIREFANLQPLPDADVLAEDESESWAWTTQSAYAATGITYVSVIPASSTSGYVTVTLQ